VKKIRKRLTYANVMSSIAVFLVLGGATALAAGLAKNSVGSKQLKKNAVTSAKIKDNAVTGAKANEGTFGQVPSAAHAGTADKATTATTADKAASADKATSATNADSANNAKTVGGLSNSQLSAASSGFETGGCDATSTTFITCVSTTLNLPHSGPVVLVAASGENSFAGVAQGTCEFSVDGVASDVPSFRTGEAASDNTGEGATNGFALTSVTGNLSAGNHTFELVCNQRSGDIEYFDSSISAQLVG
jgi:hypothetical protein